MKILSLILLLITTRLMGQDLPSFESFSETLLRVEQGDIVELQAKLKGESKTKVYWYAKDKLLCRGLNCKIDTSQLPLGYHLIVLIALNENGSSSVEYKLTIMERKVESAGKVIQVPSVEAVNDIESFTQDDQYILALEGTGFSYRLEGIRHDQSKLQMVRRFPRKLDWDEKVRASGSLLKFGRIDTEEHYLLPGSEAQLLKLKSKRRVIHFNHGTIRSRQLSEKLSPVWTIVGQDWLQVDGNPQTDIVLKIPRNSPNQAVLYVLRGEVRIRIKDPYHEVDYYDELSVEEKEEEKKYLQENSSQGIVVKAGHRVWLFNDDINKSKILPLSEATVRQFFEKTTSHHWSLSTQSKKDTDQNQTLYQTPGALKPTMEAEPKRLLESARMALQNYDSLLALDRLSRIPKSEHDIKYHEAAGIAYAQLHMNRRARYHFQKVIKARSQVDPDVSFYLGKMWIEEKDWRRGSAYLEKYIAQAPEGVPLAYYYLGVNYFQRKNFKLATSYFREVLNRSQDDQLRESSRQFLRKLESLDHFKAEVMVGLTYDSHIFNDADEVKISEQKEGLELGGAGYVGKAMIAKTFGEADFVRWKLAGDISRRGWITKAQHEADLVDQQIKGGISLNDLWSLDLILRLQTLIIGGERALDGLMGEFYFRMPHWFSSPSLYIGIGQYIDPLPGNDDLLDPINMEWQGIASDRSSSIVDSKLNFVFPLSLRLDWQMAMHYWRRTFTDELVSNQSRIRYGINSIFSYRWLSSFQLDLGLLYHSLNLPNDPAKREDSRSGIELGFVGRWYDPWLISGDLQYVQNQSNLDAYQYEPIFVQLGVAYQF